MKKRNIVLLILLPLLLFVTVPVVHAWQTGGQASGGGSGGGGASTLTDGGNYFDSGTYLFEVVYRPKNSKNREILGCAIVYSGDHKGKVGDIPSKARATSGANDCEYVSSGALQKLANQLYNGNHLDNIPTVTQREVADEYLGQFGLDINKFNKPGSEPGNINSYGYRILIQKLTCYGTTGDWCKVLYPRKAFANDYPDNLLFGAKYQNDLYTTVDDIGIAKSAYTSWSTTRGNCYNDSLCSQLGKNFANYNKGEGYNIIGFDPKVFNNHDYSIDAACENCDKKNQNGSYFIQDTTDWPAILYSDESEIPSAKNYYKKKTGGCEVFCREEYRITFPNENNKITTEAGRFFTINKLGGSMYAAGIPNYKQIKVTKVRECRAKSGNQRNCLASFANAAKSRTENSAGQTGTIKLTYKEKYQGSKYNATIELEENKDRTISKEEYINSTVDSSNVMLKSTLTKYYELPHYDKHDLTNETYRWVDIRDGVSKLKKPSTELEHYLDVGTSNLPISNENYSETSKPGKGADITFNYSLPSNSEDPYTLIKKAFNAKNDYFLNPTAEPNDNLYLQYKNGELDDDGKQQIQQSACAKLFGYGSSKFNSCVNARTSNKAGKCYSQVTQDGKYKCDINVCPKGEILCDENVCSEEGVCPNNPKCQFINNTYYDNNGNIVSKAEYERACPACKIQNGKYYGQNGKEVTKEEYLVECPQICRVENGKYYGKKGQIVTKAQYEKECPDKCMLCNGGKCCPDLDMVCPDMNGECPGRGGNRIIYRPIDLQNPFPGQTNYDRATGANWCAYSVITGKLNCKSTNGVATTHIQKNRSNKDENVYDLNPLYEVNLDSTTMKGIREYNKTNKYDDFTLNCRTNVTEANSNNSSDTVCYSTFLRESGKVKLEKSACSKKSDLATCAESRGITNE